jgi:signal transduction histidine kinase
MPDNNSSLSGLGQELLKRRWLIMALLGVMAVVLEVNERIHFGDMQLDISFFLEALVEGVFIPLIGGFILTLADMALRARTQAVYQLSRKEALTQAIANAQSWNDLLKMIAEFPRGIIPLMGSVLLVHEPGSGQFEPEAFWGLYGVNPEAYNSCHSAAQCATCTLNHAANSLKLCVCEDNLTPEAELKRLCLPLVRGRQTVALLHVYISNRVTLNPEQTKMLTSLAPEMALAIADGQSRRLNTILKDKSDAQFRHIARDLHDNLAQDLIYVRHKLDELTGEDTLQEITNIRQDLQRMREVVDDAYIDVRNTLKELEASVTTDLANMLRDYARLIEDRHGLRFIFRIEGQPVQMQTRTARQVLAIFSEIVTNIQKHAGAEIVEVHLAWKDDSLTLSVQDDGSGFDYHGSNGYQKAGHFGLEIMRERAEELSGKLTIQSAEGAGTQVTLWLPLMVDLKKGQYT